MSGLSLPSTLESIGNSAFRECVNLTRVEIPASVGHIGYFAFRDCRNLTEVDIANPACAVMSGAFDGTPVYRLSPESVNPIAPESQIVTNFVYGIVTNVVHTFSEVTNVIHTASTSTVNHYTVVTNRVEVSESVTNYVYTYSVVTNVVTYVPEAGSSPLDVYPAKAGGDAAQVVAGAAGWDALDLPEGMTWDRETGTLGGTPVRSGVYDVILVSGSGANTRMMRTTINVAGFDPVVGYVGTSFAWKGAPMTMLDSYKNLPAGLKWTASAGTLAGVPTKAGDYSRATTYGDAVPFTVEELPVTAVGTFNGLVSLGGTNYPLTVTTTKAGKLTAKIVLAAKTLSLTASSWGGWSRGTDGHLLFSATLSTKTDSLDVVLDADAAWNADQLSAAVTAGTLAGATGSAQCNAFAADADAKAAASEAAGTFTLDLEAVPGGYRLVAPEAGAVGPMTVDLKVTGAATLKGKVDAKTSLSATATLHVGPDGARSLVFFFKGSQFTWSW